VPKHETRPDENVVGENVKLEEAKDDQPSEPPAPSSPFGYPNDLYEDDDLYIRDGPEPEGKAYKPASDSAGSAVDKSEEDEPDGDTPINHKRYAPGHQVLDDEESDSDGDPPKLNLRPVVKAEPIQKFSSKAKGMFDPIYVLTCRRLAFISCGRKRDGMG
jgi:hypothetical protein